MPPDIFFRRKHGYVLPPEFIFRRYRLRKNSKKRKVLSNSYKKIWNSFHIFSGKQKYMSAECYYDAQYKCADVLNFVMLNHKETLQRILEL